MSKYQVVIASSTNNGVKCAEALFAQNKFAIAGIITPSPKKIGRKQILTKNPLHQWAENNRDETQLVERK
ncbi:MAG: hypothetical protein LBG64_04145, partial [Pseudomonadales bacterium]|nr:hypothetical protein [Pseudomonadales bacterium]